MIAKYQIVPEKCWNHPIRWRIFTSLALLFLPLLILAGIVVSGISEVFNGSFKKAIKEMGLIAFARWETREEMMKRKGWIK